ncbi:mRNA cap guanine-N(7) methyltransferase-like [Diadema antillarum]|uniref:mRNA cap guanine-N(7) methyltransferase-like n=1 Tax=Diadema antillarum TaxID=105358 RepID=UPI003A8A2370
MTDSTTAAAAEAAVEEKMEETPAAAAEEETKAETSEAGGDKPQTAGETSTEKKPGMSGTVAKHYNDLREGTVFDRTRSRIYYQRNFNNWIKSMVIANSLKAVHRKKGCTVLDLCCGKGGDLLKWTKGNIKKLVCADIAEVSVQQCQKRYNDLVQRNRRQNNPVFAAEFIAADCADVLLTERYKETDILFDLCSCQFSLHYSFEKPERARTMIRNACERLRPGGYFVGTIPNGYELVSRLKGAEGLTFGNEVYKVTFEKKEEFPLFGCKYDFHLEGVVDCPEFLIYFPLLEEMAKEFDMELVYFKNFMEIYKENSENVDNQALIAKMQALEQYPPDKFTKLASSKSDDYVHAEARHMELTGLASDTDKKPMTIGTLSKSEWEASSLYCAFAFKKAGEFEEPEEETKEEEKEVANGDGAEAAAEADAAAADSAEAPQEGEEAEEEGDAEGQEEEEA